MEEDKEVTEVEQSEEQSITKPKDEGSGFNIKAALPVLIAMVIIIILFFKMVIPALDPADHSPSRVINETKDGKYYEDFVDRFN